MKVINNKYRTYRFTPYKIYNDEKLTTEEGDNILKLIKVYRKKKIEDKYDCRKYLPLALRMAQKYKKSGIEVEDLFQEALVIIIGALKGHKESKSTGSVLAYVCRNLDWKLSRYVRNNKSLIRIPIYTQREINKYRKQGLLDDLRYNKPRINQALDAEVVSIDVLMKDIEETDAFENMRVSLTSQKDTEEMAQNSLIMQDIDKILSKEKPITRDVVRMCYFEKMRGKNIAEKLGISYFDYQNIRASIIRKLKRKFREKGYEGLK